MNDKKRPTKPDDLEAIDFGEPKPGAGEGTAEERDIAEVSGGKEGVKPKVEEVLPVDLEKATVEPETVGTDEGEREGFAEKEAGCTLYFKPGHFQIPAEDFPELNLKIKEQVIEGYRKIGAFKRKTAALLTGYDVASEKDYDCGTASFSTKTELVEVNGRKYFIVYNYPGSQAHRKADTDCRKTWGEKAFKSTGERAFKPSEQDWRNVFISRSLIPAVKGEDERVVVLPFEQNISLIDLLEKHDNRKFRGEYEYGKRFAPLEHKMKLVAEVASALRELHNQRTEDGKARTWGEVIPANLGLTPDGEMLFFDPETPYVEGTPEIEQKARDLLSWCTSACGSLNKSKHKFDDYKTLIQDIFDAYGDRDVIAYLQEHLCNEISRGKTIRHPVAYGQFKARLTISSRKQYNAIVKAMRDASI